MKLTDLLILLCVAFSLYVWSLPGNPGAGRYAFSEHALFNGGYYTLITGIFVHANLVHLAGNMLFLYIFGHILENDKGTQRFSAVFFTGGILTFILGMPFYPGEKMVGASAAIFAVMAAALLIRRPSYSFQFLSPIGPLALLFLIFNIIAIGKGEQGNVAYVSHVIGFIVGMFFGTKWNRKWKESLLYTLVLLVVYFFLYNYLRSLIPFI